MHTHILQPKHIKISLEEAEIILNQYNIAKTQLPKISLHDPALPPQCAVGDIIKIERKEKGKSILFYRVVV
jgi:DNA-directed RNA polymerase subunit H